MSIITSLVNRTSQQPLPLLKSSAYQQYIDCWLLTTEVLKLLHHLTCPSARQDRIPEQGSELLIWAENAVSPLSAMLLQHLVVVDLVNTTCGASIFSRGPMSFSHAPAKRQRFHGPDQEF